MYVPIIQKEDLTTLIFEQKLDAITREDDSIITRGITAAIDEVKLYISRFDIIKMLGDPTNDISAVFANEFFTNLVKAIAVWNVCKLANVGVDLTLMRTNYEDAIKTLMGIQKGLLDPPWPVMDNSTVDTTDSVVVVNSRKKRSNNW